MERYSEYQVAQAKKRADQNNGKLDRIIPAITVEPDKQLEYFLQSKEGKRLKDNEIELIKKLIKDGEIKDKLYFQLIQLIIITKTLLHLTLMKKVDCHY